MEKKIITPITKKKSEAMTDDEKKLASEIFLLELKAQEQILLH